MPWAATAARSTPANRTASGRRTNRAPVRNRDRSSMMTGQVAVPAADDRAVHQVRGPDLVHRAGLEPAERLRRLPARPGVQLAGGEPPLDRPLRRHLAQPSRAARIRRTCAAVRAGFSIFSPTASSTTSASVRGAHCRGSGTSASNPPSRRATTHRSRVRRDTGTFLFPSGPSCSRDARSRTTWPALPRGQGRIHRRLDQRPPPQRDLLRALPAGRGLPVRCRHDCLHENARFMTGYPDHAPAGMITKATRRPPETGSC